MKRKHVMITGLAVFALALLTVTYAIDASSQTGYDTFKSWFSDGHMDKSPYETSGQVKTTVRITDQGDLLGTSLLTIKHDADQNLTSGQVTFQTEALTQDLAFYKTKEASYLADLSNDQYYQFSEDNDRSSYGPSDKHDFDGDMTPGQERLMDYLLRDVQDDFKEVNHADGSTSLIFELEKEEIPLPVNLAVSAIYSGKAEKDHPDFEHMEWIKTLTDQWPNLTQNIELDYIYLALSKDSDGQPIETDFRLRLSGQDASGDSHEIEISAATEISDLDSAVDTFNPEGKDITLIEGKNHSMRQAKRGWK